MAFGFTPKYKSTISLYDFTPEQFYALAYNAITDLGWEIVHLSSNEIVASIGTGLFSWKAIFNIKIEGETAQICSESIGSEMVDFGKNKKKVNEFFSIFESLKTSQTKDQLDIQYQNLKAEIISNENEMTEEEMAVPEGKGNKSFFLLFIPHKGFFITPILMELNILVFLLMVLSGVNFLNPSVPSLLKWGANFGPLTLEGQWWRLLTSTFLHGGILHLLFNMYALLYIGLFLEPIIGRIRFAVFYILAGIGASITSLWWHQFEVSVGASGAIFGMYGIFLALLIATNKIHKKARKPFLASIAIFVGYNLLAGMKDGIDNAAHIGGLITGIILGLSIIMSLNNPTQKILKYGTIGLMAILTLGTSFIVYSKIPNNLTTYQTEMKKFQDLEAMALEVLALPQNTSKEEILYGLKDRGIYYWKENIKIVDSLQTLNLPPKLQQQDSILKSYCELRIKSYELMYRDISEGTNNHDEEISNNEHRIMDALNLLNGNNQ